MEENQSQVFGQSLLDTVSLVYLSALPPDLRDELLSEWHSKLISYELLPQSSQGKMDLLHQFR